MDSTLQADNAVNGDIDPSKVVALNVGTAGYRIYLPNSETDYIQQKIAQGQVPYEQEMLEDIHSRIGTDDLVLDIGANIGNHTLYLAAVSGCRVIAFEPNDELASALSHSLEINGLNERVTIKRIGLGKETAQGEFKEQFTDNLGAQSIEVGHGAIIIRALDELDIPQPVKLLKIDVEGMEQAVLEGGRKLIARDRPLIYVECINAKEFKLISAWMAQQHYTYWDTFNATPTHLFIPQEQTSLEQRLERLQFKEVFESYRTTQQLQAVLGNLTAANQKYRDACIRIDTLKSQINQSEAARNKLAGELMQSSLDLATAREAVNTERERLGQQEQQYLGKLENLAAGLKAAATERLDNHNLEQELRAQLHEARRTLDSERARCALLEKNLNDREQLCNQQAAELLQLRERIVDLRHAYDALSEEVESLKLQCEEHISSRLVSDQVLAATREQIHESQRQLESAQSSLDNERKVFIEQVAQLNQLLARKAETIEEKGQRIASLEGDIARVDEQYALLTQEHRRIAVHLETVAQQLEHEQAAKKALETVLQATEAESQEQQTQLAEAHPALQQLAQQRQTDQATISMLQAYKAAAESQVAELQLLLSETQISAVEKNALLVKIDNLETALATAQRNMEIMQSQHLEHHQQALDALREHYEQELSSLRQALKEQHGHIERLNTDLRTESEQRQLAEQRLIKIRASLTYQLGHRIKSNATSLNGLVRLPGSLIELYRQASQQRKLNQQEQYLRLSPPIELTPPTGQPQAPEALDSNGRASGVLPEKAPRTACKIACVMDEFTFGSYAPEAQLLQLTPQDWETELAGFAPEMLFIESAWRGKDALWGSKIGHNASELQQIVRWCKERQLPTIFWNKEDPVHFETFLTTAKQFDYVFTTDMDCIHRYKAALGHERVYFLPFACQPLVHNPIEKYVRKDAFCFAGAYYVRYPERTRDLESFIKELPAYRPLEIYDRNYGKDDPNYQFPSEYQPHIVGTLSFTEIDKAYKGYRFAINLNSIKQSQTMFARRVYELLGSNTLTISNYSRGVRLMFGDLVVTSDSGTEIRRRLEQLEAGSQIDKLRLAGLRKVMSEHTYADRLDYILEKVTGQTHMHHLPAFTVMAMAATRGEAEAIIAAVARQQGVQVELLLVCSKKLPAANAKKLLELGSVKGRVLERKTLRKQNLLELAGEHRWLAGMLAADYYGPNYLLDMALATRYSTAQVIGKAAYFSISDDTRVLLHNPEQAYHTSVALAARRAVIHPEFAARLDIKDWLQKLDGWTYQASDQLAIDSYNYCQSAGIEPDSVLIELVNDTPATSGIPLANLNVMAEAIEPLQSDLEHAPWLDGAQLVHLLTGEAFTWLNGHGLDDSVEEERDIKLTRNEAICTRLMGPLFEIDSQLPDGKHDYLYARKDQELQTLQPLLPTPLSDGIPMHLQIDPGLNLSLVVLYLDKDKNRLGHDVLMSNRNLIVRPTEGTHYLRFGLRVYAGGSTKIHRLVLGHLDLAPANILGQSDVLLLTNHYPSYDDLYRNGFVHSRVKAYREHNINVDIFRLRKDQPISWHEFQDIDVITGSQNALRSMLASGRYRHVLVHFLDPDMWDVLKDFINTIKVTVWVHGADIQPWYRRKFNIETPEQEKAAIDASEKRMAFWRALLNPMPVSLQVVFVSSYFAEEVMEDLGFRLPSEQYHVIHNPVDTDLFSYVEKEPEQRKKILSIRPYSSKVYANDLMVKCIEELAKEPFFEELAFHVIGNGALFDETVESLRKYANVTVEKKFLAQHEIAALHKNYGVFLCPSRYDTQGVSRDEGRASGLVAIVSDVAAIPEFVDSDSGILVDDGDYLGLARAVFNLYKNEELFVHLSRQSAERARKQVGKKHIVREELALIAGVGHGL